MKIDKLSAFNANQNVSNDFDQMETKFLNTIALDDLLSTLTDKEYDMLIMWSERYTLKEISEYIGITYENKTKTPAATQLRIYNIIKKLKKMIES